MKYQDNYVLRDVRTSDSYKAYTTIFDMLNDFYGQIDEFSIEKKFRMKPDTAGPKNENTAHELFSRNCKIGNINIKTYDTDTDYTAQNLSSIIKTATFFDLTNRGKKDSELSQQEAKRFSRFLDAHYH